MKRLFNLVWLVCCFVCLAIGTPATQAAPPDPAPAAVDHITVTFLTVADYVYARAAKLDPGRRPAPFEMDSIARTIFDTSCKYGVDPLLVTALIAEESGFYPGAKSYWYDENGNAHICAKGLMQMTKYHAVWHTPDAFAIAPSIEAGTRFLADILAKYGGNPALGIAGYHGGPDRAREALATGPKTRAHVTRVLGTYRLLQRNLMDREVAACQSVKGPGALVRQVAQGNAMGTPYARYAEKRY